jgi:hypothetical protein
MQSETANNKKQQRQRRAFGAVDTLGMLAAIIDEVRAAGLRVTTRNDDARQLWVIEIAGAHQVRTDAGLTVDVRPTEQPGQIETNPGVKDAK